MRDLWSGSREHRITDSTIMKIGIAMSDEGGQQRLADGELEDLAVDSNSCRFEG